VAVCILGLLSIANRLTASSGIRDDQDVHETSMAQPIHRPLRCLSCRFVVSPWNPGFFECGVTKLVTTRIVGWFGTLMRTSSSTAHQDVHLTCSIFTSLSSASPNPSTATSYEMMFNPTSGNFDDFSDASQFVPEKSPHPSSPVFYLLSCNEDVKSDTQGLGWEIAQYFRENLDIILYGWTEKVGPQFAWLRSPPR
jgi:hypothetical protein